MLAATIEMDIEASYIEKSMKILLSLFTYQDVSSIYTYSHMGAPVEII